MKQDLLDEGKISHTILKQITSLTGIANEALIQPPYPGYDTAALDWEKLYSRLADFYNTTSAPYLAYKSDPITFPTDRPGWYAITVNQNDLATIGAIPIAISVTMLLPPAMSGEEVLKIQQDLHETALVRQIIIAGGHTEITSAVNRLILSCNMIGMVPPEFYVGVDLKAGLQIILSGWIGAEGTGILLDEGHKFWKQYLTDTEIGNGQKIGKELDISRRTLAVNRRYHKSIQKIHDVTEGGLFSAIYETLEPHQLGAKLEVDLPIAEVTKKIGKILAIDPRQLIGSGAVLFFCNPSGSQQILNQLKQYDLPAMIIGTVTNTQEYTIGSESFTHTTDALIEGLVNLNNLSSK